MPPKLIKLDDGAWVDPATVRQIIMFSATPAKMGWLGQEVEPAHAPRVVVVTDQQGVSFEYDSEEDACAEANRMAAKVNGAVVDDDNPDDPEEADVEQPMQNVVAIGGKRAGTGHSG
jgi:hypothetical protein